MSERVIRVPAELSELADAFERTLANARRSIAGLGGGKAVDFAEVEVASAADAAQVERARVRAVLAALDVDAPAVLIGGFRYTRVGRCQADYHSRVGSVSIERSLYRRSGTRGGTPEGKVVDAVSLRAGVVGDGWLPKTARAMAHDVQRGTSREAEAGAIEKGVLPYARASFERVAHLVGALALAERQDVEDALIEAYEIPEEASAISVSMDRASVPMEEPRPRPVGRPRKDAPKRPVERNFRMAYCATVTLHDVKGEALHTIRYGCMPQGDIAGLSARLAGDAATLIGKRPDLRLELLCDGAPEMWNLLGDCFKPADFGDEIHRLVDMQHVKEKLGAAAQAIHGVDAGRTVFARWKLSLLNRQNAAATILDELLASGRDEGPGEGHPVHEAITYLQSNSVDDDRMNYARARRLGLPLGSGNVEATCKSLFELRLRRCGSRWKEATGEHIVQLRALALSDRWGPAVELILRPLAKSVRSA